jgi:hypothetical protein
LKGTVIGIGLLITLIVIGGNTAKYATHVAKGETAKAEPMKKESAGTGNKANDLLLAMSQDQQLKMLTAASGNECQVIKVFYAGVLAEDKTAFWDIECAHKSSYQISVYADSEGSSRITDCRILKAIADWDCFVAIDKQPQRPRRTEKQIRADIAHLPPKVRQEAYEQLKKNLTSPQAEP